MKTIYIGIGGNGVKSLIAIRKKMQTHKATIGSVNLPEDQFLFIDTDTKDLANDKTIDITNDFCPLAGSPYSIVSYAEENSDNDANRFFEWYDKNKSGTSHTDLNIGAGAVRMDGRAGLYSARKDLETRLTTKIKAIKAAQANSQYTNTYGLLAPSIYVFAGTSGGTGSGMVFDILAQVSNSTNNMKPCVSLFLFGPNQTIETENDHDKLVKKKCNAAACLSEWDAIKRVTADYPNNNQTIFKKFTAWPMDLNSPFAFPENTFFIDNTLINQSTGILQSVDYSVMHDVVAEFVFNLEVGKLNTFISISNEVSDGRKGLSEASSAISNLRSRFVNGRGNQTDTNGYQRMFSTFAPISICFPKDLFSEYCRLQFKCDIFENLLGSEKSQDTSTIDSKKQEFKNGFDRIIENLKNNAKPIFSAADTDKIRAGIIIDGQNSSATLDFSKEPYISIESKLNDAYSALGKYCITFFSNLLKQYPIHLVKRIVAGCDEANASLATVSPKRIPQRGFLKFSDNNYKEKLWEDCVQLILERYVYDKCSLGDSGLLDQVRKNIQTLCFKVENEVNACKKDRSSYIGKVNHEKKNPLCHYVPDLNTIVDDESNFVKNNEFYRNYESSYNHDFVDNSRNRALGNMPETTLDCITGPFCGVTDSQINTFIQFYKAQTQNDFDDEFKRPQTQLSKYRSTSLLGLIRYNRTYTDMIIGFNGVLFDTAQTNLQDPHHSSDRLLIGCFNNNQNLMNQYNAVDPIDSDDYKDRLVCFHIKHQFSINDICRFRTEYVPQLQGENHHPAFMDRRFDVRPFTKDSVYGVLTKGLVSLEPDLLCLLMLALLDNTDNSEYSFGNVKKGRIIFNSVEADYQFKITTKNEVELIFPGFSGNSMTQQFTMTPFTDDNGVRGLKAMPKSYSSSQSLPNKVSIDIFEHILNKSIDFNEIASVSTRFYSMLVCRYGADKARQLYDSFSALLRDHMENVTAHVIRPAMDRLKNM